MTHNELPCEDYYVNSLPVCEYCEGIKDVTYEPDPYNEEINNDDTPHHICAHCRHESAMHI